MSHSVAANFYNLDAVSKNEEGKSLKRLLMGMAFALLIALGMASTALAATTSHVHPFSIGGCAEHRGGPNNSFEMGVCISDRGTKHTVYPDAYVNQQPSGPFNCTLYIELWNGGTKIFQDAGHPCTVGHYNSTLIFTLTSGCAPLHTSVWISYFGTFYRIGDSPTYTYCA
jgi:hypothetical protein